MDSHWHQYIRGLRLGRFPMLALWESQKKSLEGGLLGKESLILSMPTSAGKTRTVELAIYDDILKHSEGLCVYVVPTRALAAEVERSLSSRLRRFGITVSVLYGGYDLSLFEEELLSKNRVIVLTPEKLDLLIRNNEDIRGKITLVIVDEVQQCASSSARSLRIELIMSRILRLIERNNARVLCLSAVIENPEDFSIWISGNSENMVVTKWRPTVQRYGVFQWTGSRGRIWYPPLENEFPSDDFFVPLIFSRKDLKDGDRGRFEVAARMSVFYARTGTTLIFTTTKFFVERITDIVVNLIRSEKPAEQAERGKIAKDCADILGEEHKLVEAMKLGVCYHHGGLPRSVRKIVEKGIRDGALRIIVSTTTLTEGVNLPIKNVIVHSLSLGNNISATQFENAAGRAGRAGYETEGHIIFCYYPDLQKIATSESEKTQSFISSGIRILTESRLPSIQNIKDFLEKWSLASTPQFRADGTNFESWTTRKLRNAQRSQREILDILDSQLLAWAIEESLGEIDDEVVSGWINKTLFSVQTLDIPEETKKLKESVKNRFLAVLKAVTDDEERKSFNRTGLSISSNQTVKKLALEIQPSLSDLKDLTTLPREFLLSVYEGMKEVQEFSELASISSELLADWIEGVTYKDLADKHYDGDIEKTVRNVENAIFPFPWGCHSLIVHLKAIIGEENIPRLIWNLPAFVYHGVPALAAVYALHLGISDREFAIRLAIEYQKEHEKLNYIEFKDWLQAIEYTIWLDLFKDKPEDIIEYYYNEISIRKEVSEQTKVILEFNLLDYKEVGDIPDHDLIIANYKGEFWLCTYDFQRIGRLTGPNVDRLAGINRREFDILIQDFDRKAGKFGARIL